MTSKAPVVTRQTHRCLAKQDDRVNFILALTLTFKNEESQNVLALFVLSQACRGGVSLES